MTAWETGNLRLVQQEGSHMNHHAHAPQENAILPRMAAGANAQGLRINELTAYADVSERLVRHCEGRGLIRRTEQSYACGRNYSHEDVCILRFVRRAHVLGFGMNEVARLLSLWRDMDHARTEEKSIDRAPAHALESHSNSLDATWSVLERLANVFPVQHQPACPILEALLELSGRNSVCSRTDVSRTHDYDQV